MSTQIEAARRSEHEQKHVRYLAGKTGCAAPGVCSGVLGLSKESLQPELPAVKRTAGSAPARVGTKHCGGPSSQYCLVRR